MYRLNDVLTASVAETVWNSI